VSRFSVVCLDMAGTTIRDGSAVMAAFGAAIGRRNLHDVEFNGAMKYARDTMGQSKIEVFRHIRGDEDAAQAANAAFEKHYAGAVAADVPEHLDLRLAHRVARVLHRPVVLVVRQVPAADRGTEGGHHGVAVADGCAGHVQADDGKTAHWKVSSAIAGEQVMPRPPGPVTRTTPGMTAERW